MPRTYKPNPLGKRYKKYPNDVIEQAVREYNDGVATLNTVAQKYGINRSVLYRHSTKNMKTHGGQTVLSKDTEKAIVKLINLCADRVQPLGVYDLRIIVKKYLDKAGMTVKKFKDNMPGPDFAVSFLNRHNNRISQSISRGIRRKRAYNNNNAKTEIYPFDMLDAFDSLVNSENVVIDAVNKTLGEMKTRDKEKDIVVQEDNDLSCNEEYIEEYIDDDIESALEPTFISIPENRIKEESEKIYLDIEENAIRINEKQGRRSCSVPIMSRKKSNSLGKKYKKYSNDLIKQAVREYRRGVGSLGAISEKFGIAKSVLHRHSTRRMKTHGGQTVLSKETEKAIVTFINLYADRVPLGFYDIRLLVKKYLDESGIEVKRFKDNMPRPDFAASFLNRHKDTISRNISRHIRKNRSKIINTETEHILSLSEIDIILNSDDEVEDTEKMNKLYVELLKEKKAEPREEGDTQKEVDVLEEDNFDDFIEEEYLEEYIEDDTENVVDDNFIPNLEKGIRQNCAKSVKKIIEVKTVGKKSKCNKCDCHSEKKSTANEITELITNFLTDLNSDNSVFVIIT